MDALLAEAAGDGGGALEEARRRRVVLGPAKVGMNGVLWRAPKQGARQCRNCGPQALISELHKVVGLAMWSANIRIAGQVVQIKRQARLSMDHLKFECLQSDKSHIMGDDQRFVITCRRKVSCPPFGLLSFETTNTWIT